MGGNGNSESAVSFASRFLGKNVLAVVVISTALILPCFWHRHLEAGDLSSHVYNAWLAQLAERGQAPRLSIAPQKTNVLVDVALVRLGSLFGFELAGQIVASGCVLLFFWGAFAFLAAACRKPPWFLVPAIAMVAYGWTFQMGFLNYYLALGAGFFAIALGWRGGGIDRFVAVLLAAIALVAHPLGFFYVIAVGTYVVFADRLIGRQRWMLIATALSAVVAVRFYLGEHFRTQGGAVSFFGATSFSMNTLGMTGVDQLVLFGARYAALAAVVIVFAVFCIFREHRERSIFDRSSGLRTALEVWAILLFAAALLPELIQFPQYARPVAFMALRLTSISVVLGLAVLASIKPRWWHGAGFALAAVAFFAMLFFDTGTLNRMESQADMLVGGLPSGQRVVARIAAPGAWRVPFIAHMVDRACIGHCFAYGNYEASSKQFRIRTTGRNAIVDDSADEVEVIESGAYLVKRQDLPMTLIYQCDASDWTRLCQRELSEGDKLGMPQQP